MIKFSLTTNDHDGFKLITHADSEKDVEVLKELTEKLIAKIEKIEVSVGSGGY